MSTLPAVIPILPGAEVSGVINPQTGELVSLDAETKDLGEAFQALRDLEADVRSAKTIISREVHRRFDEHASWSYSLGEYTLQGEAPNKVRFDPEALYRVLGVLVSEGKITTGAAEEAVEVITSYKAKWRGILALKKLGGDVENAIKSCERPLERDRRLTVRR